jgi:hypothetical protein
MATWTNDELDKIAGADELRIASRRRDGTLNSPRIIWVVRYGDDLYVRSVNGRDSAWFRGSQVRREGHIQAGGGQVTVIRPGDTIWTPPGDWHWHGAASDHFTTHLAMWEGPGEGQGPETQWGDLVTDTEYHATSQ